MRLEGGGGKSYWFGKRRDDESDFLMGFSFNVVVVFILKIV